MNNNLLENLNQEQLKAVTHPGGPMLIVAGAGTGKTTVIAQRLAYLIEQGKAAPEEILALTFTEKAAGEMTERVDRLLPLGYLDLWISTFHGFGERILKEHGLEIGLPAGFKMLNEFEQWALVQKNLAKFNLDYYKPLGNPTKFIHALVKHFSRLKDEDISPADYLKYAEELKQNLDRMLSGGGKKISNFEFRISNKNLISNDSKLKKSKLIQNSKLEIKNSDANNTNSGNIEIAEQEVMRINEVANAYHIYQQLLLDNDALDFGDLINYALKMFRDRPKIRDKYRRQFKYILVDEFQDTNWAQYELIKLLVGPESNLTVVGDDDQSIYKFRGASVANILQFKKDFPMAKEVFLVNNYRNTQNILDISYDFIQQNNPNRLEWQLNESKKLKVKSKKLIKKLKAENKGEGMVEVITGKDLYNEIRLVIERVAELKIKDKDCSWDDFGILVRANDSAKDICNALDQAGLPYQFLASRGLYAKPVIMDAVAYFKLLDNYHENTALYRVLSLPIFNFSYQELVNFNYWAYKKAWSLYEVLKSVAAFNFGPELQTKVNNFLQLIAKHTAMVRDKSAAEIFIAFLNDSGYLKYLTGQEESESRETVGYLNQFMKRIQEFEAGNDDKSVKGFLAELNLEIQSGEEGGLAFDPESGPEAIKVMTVHAAKGLEYKYVFITNLVDKRFPTIERGEQISVPDALVKEVLPTGDMHLQEERRLFYVAMTRAKRGLFFSWAPDYGGARRKKPSRFLTEINLVSPEEEDGSIINHKSEILNSKQSALGGLNSKSKILKDDYKQSFTLPSYISYSQLAAFNNCPYQYRFAHILKIPIRGKMVFSFGKTMHSALQKLFVLADEKKGLGQGNLFGGTIVEKPQRGGATDPSTKTQNLAPPQSASKISPQELAEIFEQSWIDDWYESKEQKIEYKKLGLAALKDFYEKHKDNWPTAKFLEKGFNFKVKHNNQFYTVRGVIDRIDETGTGIKIIDYKTGKPKDKLSFEEKEQLLIYQIALQETPGLSSKPVTALAFYYLENNSEMEFTATPEDLVKMEEKIISTIEALQGGEFPPKPSMLCAFCDFKDICEFRKI